MLEGTGKHILLIDVKRLLFKNFSMPWGFIGQRYGYTQVVFTKGYDIPLLKWPSEEATKYYQRELGNVLIAGVLKSYGAGFIVSYPATIANSQYDAERFLKNITDFSLERKVLAPGEPFFEECHYRFDTLVTTGGDCLAGRLLEQKLPVQIDKRVTTIDVNRISKFFLSGDDRSHITIFMSDGKRLEGETPLVDLHFELVSSAKIKIERQELQSLFTGILEPDRRLK